MADNLLDVLKCAVDRIDPNDEKGISTEQLQSIIDSLTSTCGHEINVPRVVSLTEAVIRLVSDRVTFRDARITVFGPNEDELEANKSAVYCYGILGHALRVLDPSQREIRNNKHFVPLSWHQWSVTDSVAENISEGNDDTSVFGRFKRITILTPDSVRTWADYVGMCGFSPVLVALPYAEFDSVPTTRTEIMEYDLSRSPNLLSLDLMQGMQKPSPSYDNVDPASVEMVLKKLTLSDYLF
jgi:hypothetical protein